MAHRGAQQQRANAPDPTAEISNNGPERTVPQDMVIPTYLFGLGLSFDVLGVIFYLAYSQTTTPPEDYNGELFGHSLLTFDELVEVLLTSTLILDCDGVIHLNGLIGQTGDDIKAAVERCLREAGI